MNIKLRKYVIVTMLFRYIQYATSETCHWIMEKYFHQKICRQRRKHNFPFIKIINFIKLRTCHARQCKIQMFSIDCITTKSLIFFIIRLLKQWTYQVLSSFFVVLRKIPTRCFFFCWILCDMRWNELVPLYVIRRSSTTEKKILTQKLCRLNCTRYHFHLHQKTFLSCTRYGRSNM